MVTIVFLHRNLRQTLYRRPILYGTDRIFPQYACSKEIKNVPFAQEFKVSESGGNAMKRCWILGICVMLATLPCVAQQVIYSNLKDLVANVGDTVTTLRVERRTKNQIFLMGGADYRIEAKDNPGLCKYLKSRCYAVRIDTALYVNCKKMRYNRFRFGGWYAPAMWINNKIYFCAQPVGQAAASTTAPTDATKLGGEVGDAIAASGLTNARVYYELNPENGKSTFVGKDKMMELLNRNSALQEAFSNETSECAEVIGKYLRQLK